MLASDVTDDLDLLLDSLPPRIAQPLRERTDNSELLEVVMDLGRIPEARYPGREVPLSPLEVTQADIDYVTSRIGDFGADNRAGIERTLHRISAIRNRRGKVVGLTCRVGRAVFGTIRIIEDLVQSGKSILLLGRPGVGKTTMLREVARVLADQMDKRVIVVDTSNEIAGDGDIPHPGIGRSRRMQVPTPLEQHAVMIEAVENHMPEVIVIDEIGTELEALAARTIAERGVQLVATAHGNALENLMMNPTLADLIGGIQSVTLGDEEARRRGTQKSILERKAPPTFDVLVEIQSWQRVAVHADVADTVDALLRGFEASPEVRQLNQDGEVQAEIAGRRESRSVERRNGHRDGAGHAGEGAQARPGEVQRLYPFGISRSRLYQAIRDTHAPVTVVDDMREADAVITLRNYYRRKPQVIVDAEQRNLPVYVLRSNTLVQMEQVLSSLREWNLPTNSDPVSAALKETEDAITEVMQSERPVELSPQNAYIRRLQHEMAQRFNLSSRSAGREPYRRVRLFPGAQGYPYEQ
jgi:stage III sporulation protein SpoIIIAA